MKWYGWRNFNRMDRGCCPGHDRVYAPYWKTRTCETTIRIKRYPKKVERMRENTRLRAMMKNGDYDG